MLPHGQHTRLTPSAGSFVPRSGTADPSASYLPTSRPDRMPKHLRSTVGLAVCASLLPACEAATDQVSTAAGPQVVAREVVRIGSIDDPTYSLTRVGQLLALPAGGVLATHPSEGLIRRFDSAGELVYSTGGMGDGPGEFQGLGATTLLGDTIAVADFRTGLVSYFDLETGDHLESVRVDLSGSTFDDRPLSLSAVLAPDVFVAYPSTPSSLVASGDVTTIDFLLADGTGQVIDTLPSIPRGNGQWSISFPGGGGAYSRQVFADEALYRIHGDGRLTLVEREVVDSDAPTIEVVRITPAGDTVWTTSLSYTAQGISDAEVDSIIEARTPENPLGGRSRSDYAEGWRASMYVPPHRPGASSLMIGQDERIWVGGATGAPETTWWVLSPTGELDYTVALPSDLSVMSAAGDRVWAVAYDELDVPYVVGLEVEAREGPVS